MHGHDGAAAASLLHPVGEVAEARLEESPFSGFRLPFSRRLHELDPVAERVVHVEAPYAGVAVVPFHLGAVGAAEISQSVEVTCRQGRVSPARRGEIAFYAKVKLDVAGF